MNKLINFINKEHAVNILASIVYACERDGYFSCNANVLRDIKNKYLPDRANKKPKTPINTLNTALRYTDKGRLYFNYDNGFLRLKDVSELPFVKEVALSRLEDKRIKKTQNIKIVAASKYEFKNIFDFEKAYPDINSFVIDEVEVAISKYPIIAISASVKSGKKIIKQLLGTRHQCYKKEKVIVLSSLNRKDCKSQREEFAKFGIEYLLFDNKKNKEKNIEIIREALINYEKVLLLHDESDYGTADKQLISDLYYNFSKHNNCTFILFSASNEEAVLSGLVEKEAVLTYVPPKSYRGALHYVTNELVIDAEPFFDISKNELLSAQGEEVLSDFLNSDKKFLVVRVAAGKEYAQVKAKLVSNLKRNVRIIFVNEKEPWDWGPNGDYRKYNSAGDKNLIVICQTAGRSVEWDKLFLRDLYALHDYRKEETCYNTKIQAQLRPSYFWSSPEDDNINPIIYGDLQALNLAAALERCKSSDKRLELYSQYNNKLSSRVMYFSKKYEEFDYKLLRFSKLPLAEDIKNECSRLGIASVKGHYVPKLRNVSTTSSDDLAKAVLNGKARSTNTVGGVACYYLNGPSSKYRNSWIQLMSNGYHLGEYIVLIPINIKNSALPKHTTSNGSVFSRLN